MHQPDYRHYASGEFRLPWTYLHALKDYSDMAYQLEANRQAKAVFNFVPILLEQLEVYAAQLEHGDVSDPLLKLLLVEDPNTYTVTERALILSRCFACNHATMLEPYPYYKHLHELYKLAKEQGSAGLQYLSGQYLADLLTWYHLVWTGESVRRHYPLIASLMAQGGEFHVKERRNFFQLIAMVIREIIPRYKALLAAKQIEISTTPYFHPISPLLMDFKSARAASPQSELPDAAWYPGGRKRASFHLTAALASHRDRFGEQALGVWPAEGGISEEFVRLMAREGVTWTATGEGVLANSWARAGLTPQPKRDEYLYRPYRVKEGANTLLCFFRDEKLSDKIGFEYAKWDARDAVNNFIFDLEEILKRTPETEDPVVSVILDGENAWEYYPYNAYYFLSGLYAALDNHPQIKPTTFKDYLHEQQRDPGPSMAREMPPLVAGSWVYGNFSTWMGAAPKNRAWDLLAAAKQSFDLTITSGRLSQEHRALAERQLANCEASDWFWWFGDYNPADSVADFDKLYRENLSNLYRLLQLPIPQSLSQPISMGSGYPEARGAMRRAT